MCLPHMVCFRLRSSLADYSTHTVYLINLCNTFKSIHWNLIVYGFCVFRFISNNFFSLCILYSFVLVFFLNQFSFIFCLSLLDCVKTAKFFVIQICIAWEWFWYVLLFVCLFAVNAVSGSHAHLKFIGCCPKNHNTGYFVIRIWNFRKKKRFFRKKKEFWAFYKHRLHTRTPNNAILLGPHETIQTGN